MNNSMNC